MLSFTVNGGGPVLSGTGLDMNNQDVSDIKNLDFNDPTANTIEQTAGALIIDNIMGKDRNNVMTTGSGILFSAIGDVAAELDAFQLPRSSALPTATPANNSNNGFLVSFGGAPYHWNGSAWDDLTTAVSTQAVLDTYIAAGAVAIRDAVYIAAAGAVTKCDNDVDVSSYCLGFATVAAADTASVTVQKSGILAGFTALTVGAPYYLDGTAGLITATLPAGNSGKNIVRVGFALSTTQIDIQIQYLSKRGT